MTRRLVVAAAIALAVVQASGASGAAAVRLDGQGKTSHSYRGSLAGPTVYAGLLAPEDTLVVTPTPRWCTEDTCDKTELRLDLPRGRHSGRLVVELSHSSTSRMHLGVYDEEWTEVPPQNVVCCDQDRLVAAQLPAGLYHVVVYDDAGSGTFETNVSWKANRPHRSPAAS